MIAVTSSRQFGAGVLALLTHGLLLLMLVFGVSWQTRTQSPVYADLWTALPAQPRVARPEPPDEPAPEPDPKPLAEPPARADIPIQVRPERKRAKEPEKAKPVPKPPPEAKKKKLDPPPDAEKARRLAEDELARQLKGELDREAARLKQVETAARADARGKLIRDYQERIRSKIRGYLRLPPNLAGNPEVVYQVHLMPDGEVLRVALLRPSGQPAYDQEVERAILKASPLPLPPDREAAAVFRAGLELKFRPRED